jgi:hypothetical protein
VTIGKWKVILSAIFLVLSHSRVLRCCLTPLPRCPEAAATGRILPNFDSFSNYATHIGRFALHSRQVERTYNFTYRRTLWRKRAPLVVAKTPRKHKDKHARLTLPHRSRLQRTNKQRRQRQRNGARAQSRMRRRRLHLCHYLCSS